MKHLFRYIIAAAGLVAMAVPAMAQDYYDDIYGGPRKPSKPKKQDVEYQVADYAPADSYAPSGSLDMDVDTYNRRGQFLVSDSVQADSAGLGDTFAYTRRIERFHNPEVVTESGDTTLCDYYYSSPQETNVNIYVVNDSPYYPYSWAWRYGNPWYWNVYGPAYIGWGGWCGGWYNPYWYDPYPWGWSWGWTWTPGWGGWGPGWGPGWWGSSVAWHPNTPGASQPHRPTGSGMNSGRGSAGNHYAGNGGYNSSRPGNMGRPSGSNSFSGSQLRPGYSGTSTSADARPGTRPSPSQGTYIPYGAGTRGRNSSTTTRNSSTSSPSRNSYNSNTRRDNSSNRNSYNSGSSRSSYGSYGSGSNSTRGGGSSGRSSGGGGSRGRR